MNTIDETLLQLIAEVNHADALSSTINDRLPEGIPAEIVSDFAELCICIARIQQKCGELQRSQNEDGSLVMPPPGFVAPD